MNRKSAFNPFLIIIIVAVLLLLGGTVWYWQKSKIIKEPPPPPPPVATQKPIGLGAQIFQEAQNPLKNQVPETNPFETDTNPFDVDANPFKDQYKNPFK